MAETYESMELLGMAADDIDNLLGAMQLPVPAQVHLDGLRATLPKIRDRLRAVYVAEMGENPWEHTP